MAILSVMGWLLQFAMTTGNDVADVEADRDNTTFASYSGGSRVLVQGELSVGQLRSACAGSLAVAALLSAWLSYQTGNVYLLATAPVAAFMLWIYSGTPFRLSYRGYGEWVWGLGLGLGLPVLGYLAQGGAIVSLPWLALLPGVLVAATAQVLISLPDEPSDRRLERNTYAVRFGVGASARHVVQLLGLAITQMTFVVPNMNWTVWVVLVATPIGILSQAIPLLPRARPDDPPGLTTFSLLCGSVIVLLWAEWIITLLIGFLLKG